MAVYKEVFRKKGTNSAAALTANYDWASALRVRMSELEEARYGACNTLRIVNSDSHDICVSFTYDVARTDSIIIKGNSIYNMQVDDGKAFYGFDIYSADAAADVAQNAVTYSMSRVEQFPEAG